jgi:hypothetical protein
MDLSLENFERVKDVVCPPSPEDMSKLILAGYHDAVAFLGTFSSNVFTNPEVSICN